MHSTVSTHTSPVKDGRRILGEKTVNACLSPARHRHAASLSPVKRPFLETPSLTSPSKKLLPSPLFAGQKRSIDQVEGHREHESSARERAPVQAPAPAPIHAQVGSTTKSPAIAADEHILSDATQQPIIPDLETPPPPPQQQQKQNEVEPQQQQQQQQQQQLPPPPEPSQLPAQTQPISTRAVLSDPATRKRFIQEKATLLRTRLQTAMRHVRDPQFDRRLSELEAHSRKCPRLTTAVVPGSQTPAPKDTTRMAAAAVAAAAAADPKTPVPFITSTTPSNLQQPEHNTSPDNDNNNHASGLSSPPLSTGNDAVSALEEDDDDPMKTPTQKMYRHTTGTGNEASPMMQLSSPPATVSRRRTGTGMGTVPEESDVEEDGVGLPDTQRRLSQKGDAVDGLLKLMGTAEQQQQQQQQQQAEKAEVRTG
ncbi:uncharacterized protein BO95DRAFT_512618 [Aspergillus brunneoviolaceus CBS 621.78]|uniref:Uncharacterized protein n=1 Tax=Aspergillus brunneoviolaceus CBS 621.78 TaxID=1450534 RepID=A0ACD1GFG9_9EURO|nr:hypothetical protein BO95DRAFT_512618 [Aspergillus brunneoviolaceus CBS 621.78]RAH48039.1 hypothetical protein BO95DRAFT_512618 [Aspergillus brunneoviolaceus CBS 621.78]